MRSSKVLCEESLLSVSTLRPMAVLTVRLKNDEPITKKNQTNIDEPWDIPIHTRDLLTSDALHLLLIILDP